MDIFLKIGDPTLHNRIIEPNVLKETSAFHEAEGERLLKTCDASEYLQRVSSPVHGYLHLLTSSHVEARSEEEEARAMQYLSSDSYPAIRQTMLSHLLEPCLMTILLMPGSGLDSMIDGDKLDDLSRLYKLFSMVPEGIPSLGKKLKSSIERRGNKINAVDNEADEDSHDKERARADHRIQMHLHYDGYRTFWIYMTSAPISGRPPSTVANLLELRSIGYANAVKYCSTS